MPDAGLTPTEQAPASAIATVDLEAEDGTVTDLWRALFDHHPFRDAFVRSLRAVMADRTVPEVYDRLEDRDVPAWLQSRILAVGRGDRREAWRLVADILPGLGRDVGSAEDLLAVAELVDGLEEPRTVAVRLGESFRERRRGQRGDVLALLATLAKGLDVRLVTSGVTRAFLAANHRADLPGVSEWYGDHQDVGPLADAVEAALVDLDPDGRPVALLRALAAEPGETLAYTALYAEAAGVDESRVRQVIGQLRDLGLVATFGPSTDRNVELLAAGREFLDALDAEHGRQATLADLEERVSESGQSHSQAVLSREHGRGEGPARERTAGDAPPEAAGGGTAPYRTAYLGRPAHAAAAGAAEWGAVTLVDSRLGACPEGPDHTRYVSYEAGRDEAVVAVRATGALQYMVSLGVALASPRFLDRALPVDRLDAIDEPPAILRDARCVGALSEEAAEDGAVLQEALVEWGETLEDITTDLRREEYEDRDRFRSEILRSAHGLAGTVTHLLDAVGVDLVREIRVPAGLGEDKHTALARSVAVSAAIQSRYGVFASYRQLYEDREGKRETALSPEVDAADPVGEVIGSYVLRGQDLHRVRPHLEEALTTPADLHEDAPEFAVRVPVHEAGREAVATAVSRILDRKRLQPTRAAVSVVHGLVGSPHAATEALHQLAENDTRREVRPDELRYALGTLEADALLPEAAPTVGAIVAALLRAEGRLSQTDLAERADVSTRSVRRHRDVLEALDLVDVEAEGGWRLSLSFRTAEERRDGRLPAPVTTDTAFAEAVDAVAAAVLPPEEYADPGGDVYKSLSWPPDPWPLAEHPRLEPWIEVAAALVGADPPTTDRTVRMGPAIEQAPLPTNPMGRPRPDVQVSAGLTGGNAR